MAFIEKHHEQLREKKFKARQAGPDSAAVIVLRSATIKWVPVREMIEHADMKNRRGKHSWWGKHKGLVESLVGRQQLL